MSCADEPDPPPSRPAVTAVATLAGMLPAPEAAAAALLESPLLYVALATSSALLVTVLVLAWELRRVLRSNRAAAEARKRLDEIIRGTGSGTWDWDVDTGAVTVSESWATMLGYQRDELEPFTIANWQRMLHPEDLSRFHQLRDAMLSDGASEAEFEARTRHRNGDWHWMKIRGAVLARAGDGHPTRVAGTQRDVSRGRRNSERLRIANAIFERANEGIFVTDAEGRIEWTNRAFEDITGFPEEDVRGLNAGFMRSGRHRDSFYDAMWRTLQRNGRWSGEIYNRRKDGSIYPCLLNISALEALHDAPVRYVALLSDITELKARQSELRRLAYFDGLTGLPNRKLLQDRLGQAMAQVRRQGGAIALLFLDVDDFKNINDRCGHAAGDDFLRSLGNALAATLRGGDTVARLGGDEFVVLLVERDEEADFAPVVERLQHEARLQVNLPCCEPLSATASFGLASYNSASPPLTPDQLLRRADNAMYQAKLAGGDRCHVFDPRQDAETISRLASLQETDRAIRDGELRIRYQPIQCLATGATIGVEALVRWAHPDRGLLSPAEFLPHIADSDVEISLGTWMLREASGLRGRLAEAGYPLYVSVNIAANHLYAPHFFDDLAGSVPAQDEDGGAGLQLEIVETTALQDLETARERIEQCRQLGVHIALDDFGTGFSSLTYLRELPVDTVKLDRSFVSRIDVSEEDSSIVATTISLAHALGKRVTAEGVESLSQLEMLCSGQCDAAQGYLIARPMSESALMTWLTEDDTPLSA